MRPLERTVRSDPYQVPALLCYMRTNKIYLVGFMGAGKTTIARHLGRRLGWRVEDIDSLVEAREQRDIPSIFAENGELHFRALERAVLHGLLPLRDTIVATGGGTFVESANRDSIQRDGVSIWLDIPFARVIERIPSHGSRPLASDRTDFARLFDQRRGLYALAHLHVDADRPVDEVVERILDWLEH